MSTVSLRDALLKTLDLIKRRPGAYHFWQYHVPTSDADSDGQVACIIGWVSYYRGMDLGAAEFYEEKVFDGAGDFYRKVGNLTHDNSPCCDAIPKVLEEYIEKYHPA